MSEIHLTWGLPCCSSKQVQETNLSLRLRITAIVIGIILISAGSLSLAGTPFFNQLGMIESWSLIASGIVLSLIPAVVKQVKVSEVDSSHSSSSGKRSSHGTDERSDASDAAADPIEGQSKGLCHFERLPLELKKELLKFLDTESLVAFSMTNKQNLQLIKDCNYEKKIQAGRWRRAALNAWKKSLFSDESVQSVRFSHNELNTRILLNHYPKQMMKEFSSALAEIKRMDKDKQVTALARIAYILPELAWKCPEAAKIVNQLPKLGLKGLIWDAMIQDVFVIEYHSQEFCMNEYYIRAFSATDPDYAIALFQKLLDDRTKVRVLPWIIAGCVSTKTPKTKQFLEEFHSHPTWLNTCLDNDVLSFLIERAGEKGLPEVVQELLTSVAAPLTYADQDFILIEAVVKACISFNNYDDAFEWVDKIPDTCTYKERLLIFFAQQCTLETTSNALVFLQKLQTRAQKLNEQGRLATVEIAIQLHPINASKAKLCIQPILDILKGQKNEKLLLKTLLKILKFYSLFDLGKVKEMADQISIVDTKIKVLVLIAKKTPDETLAKKIFEEAIICLQKAGKQMHEEERLVYYIAKHYASISISHAETLLLNFYKRWRYNVENKDDMYQIICLPGYPRLATHSLEILVAIDFKKAFSFLQSWCNNSPSKRAFYYLQTAETLIESDNPIDHVEFSL